MTDERITSPAHTITLDGREFKLRFDLAAMADFEEETGANVLLLVGEALGVLAAAREEVEAGASLAQVGANLLLSLVEATSLRAGDLAVLLWACAGGQDSELTVREVAREVTPATLPILGGALMEAIRTALPEGEEEVAESDPTESPTG